MPKRSQENEFSAGLGRLQSWAWLSELTRYATITELHLAIGVPKDERGPLFDVAREGASPRKVRLGGRVLADVLASRGLGQDAAHVYDHYLWRLLADPTDWKNADAEVSCSLRPLGLEVIEQRESCLAHDLGMSGIDWIDEEDPRVHATAESYVSLLNPLGPWGALAVCLVQRSKSGDPPGDNPVSAIWRCALDVAIGAAKWVLPVAEARDLLDVLANHYVSKSSRSVPSSDEVMRALVQLKKSKNAPLMPEENALLPRDVVDDWDEPTPPTPLSKRKLQRLTRWAWMHALAQPNARRCGLLVRSNPWTSYLRANYALLDQHAQAAAYAHAGCSVMALPPVPTLPEWEGGRISVRGLAGNSDIIVYCSVCHEPGCDPLVPVRRAIAATMKR